MTIIVGKKTKSGFTIGSDSLTMYSWMQTKGKNTTSSKLFKENDLVVGGAGSVEESNLFRLFLRSRQLEDVSERGILELMSDFFDWKKSKTDSDKLENSYLMGTQGKLFLVEEWNIEEVKTFYAIGAGMWFAMTALHLGHSCKKSVEVAIELSPYCEGPYQKFKG